MTAVEIRPTGPYSLAQSARGRAPWRRTNGVVVEVVLEVAGAPAHAHVWQRSDGVIVARIATTAPDAAIAALRFVLATDVDHRPFLEIAARDPLLRDVVGHRRGMRPIRTPTVAHALVTALAGQLITSREAWLIERRIAQRAGRAHAGLVLPLAAGDLAALPAAELVRLGLAPRRAASLARIVRTLDLERLRALPTRAAVARLQRERTLGPWSAGVIATSGMGRYEHGLVGDLGLMKLCANLLGRPATEEDTRRLLDRYGEWAGLASAHLLSHPLAHRRPARAA